MPFRLNYHPDVRHLDLPRIDERMRQRIRRAIESRLTASPQSYGVPLRKTLRGYWKPRVGDYRVVFKIASDEVMILGIVHRKTVYGEA